MSFRATSFIEVHAGFKSLGSRNFNEANRVYWRNMYRFIKLPEEAKAAAYQVAKDTAARMESQAPIGSTLGRRKSPKRKPGRLRDAIKAQKAPNGGYIEWNHLNRAPHWEAVEYGARPHIITGPNGISFRPHGHFGRANPGTGVPRKAKRKGKGINNQGDINVPYVKHPGNRAQPYIEDNIAWAEDELWMRVTGLGRKFRDQTSGRYLGKTVHQRARMSTSRGGKKPL